MTEYIKKSDVLAYPIRYKSYDKANGNPHFISGIESVMEFVEGMPAADAVPVVRRRECSFGEKQQWSGASKLGDSLQQGGGCSLHKFGALENDFCSRGKRKGGRL